MAQESFARSGEAAETSLAGLQTPLRDMLVELLLYKSVFMGAWFEALARRHEDPLMRDALLRIREETIGQAVGTIQEIHAWDGVPGGARTVDDVRYAVRTRLLEDLLVVKEGGTEVALSVAMAAPTEAIRQAFVHLADRDRRHADELRHLLGVQAVGSRMPAAADLASHGAHEGRYTHGPLYRSVQATLNQLIAAGHVPSRLVLSPGALRHLRDEGSVDSDKGSAFGLPVEVDFGWGGEAFAVLTRERASLAELITAAREGERGEG